MKSVGVYCASSQNLDSCFHDAAKVIGKGLAQRNLTLIYGGGCIGLMGEVASVAADHSGEVVGVITHKLVAHEQANEKCDELIVVDTMQERRTVMMQRSDAFIVLPGGIGTYEEFFEVLVGRQLGDHTKPIGIVNVDGCFDPLVKMLEHGIERNFMRPALRQLMFIDPCPNAVLDYITSGNNYQPTPEDILPMHGTGLSQN
jgi:uncharacterized protein (TIGR00730 family)